MATSATGALPPSRPSMVGPRRRLRAQKGGRGPAHRTGFVLLLACLALATAPGVTLGGVTPSAGAQTIEDARAQAEALEAELSATREQLIVLAEEYNRATADLQAARALVEQSQVELDRITQAAGNTRNQLRDYAIGAYVAGGPLQELDGFFGASLDKAGQRLNYLRSATGNRQQLIDDFAAANARVVRQRARMADAEAAAASQQLRLGEARAQAESLESHTSDLLAQVSGRLATLVAEAAASRAEQERVAALAVARQAGIVVAAAPGRTSEPAPTGGAGPERSAGPAPARFTPPPGLRPEAAMAVQAALSQLGVPYVFGGATPDQGFDCSGLMRWAWGQAGVSIARPADYQRDDAIPLRYEDLQPGDLVFYGDPPSHVGMYIGNDEIVNAPQTGELVSTKTMWYSRKPMSYGRVA